MPLVHDLPPDTKWERPRSLPEAVWQIEQTFKDNRWDESEQIVYLAGLNLDAKWLKLPETERDEILKNWRNFDNSKLRKIINDLHSARMILYK